MPKWIRPGENEEEEVKPPVIEIKPEQVRDAIKNDLDGLKASSDAMMQFIREQKEEKEAAAARAADAERRKNKEEREASIDFTLDPEGAFNERMRPVLESQAAMASILLRKEILGNGEAYEYYADPDFRKDVDRIIDSQPVASRTNAELIKNAYKSVFFDKQQAIKEGKVKSSLSITSSGGNRETEHKEESSAATMNQAEKEYARKLGISEKDWLSQKKEMEYV